VPDRRCNLLLLMTLLPLPVLARTASTRELLLLWQLLVLP
jgi:hypothetical protein